MEKNYDFLNIKYEKNYIKLFKNEEIILSSKLYKINERGFRQNRNLIITNKNLYNLDGIKIKRIISLENIESIIYSNMSCEFTIVIPKEYDYRFSSYDLRDEIIECLVFINVNILNRNYIKIYYYDSINLTKYTTTETLAKSKKRIFLNENVAIKVNTSKLKDKYIDKTNRKTENKKKTTTLLKKNKNEDDITIDDFDLIKVLGKGAFGKVILAEKIVTGKLYAIKILNKEHIIKQNQLEHTKVEKQIMKHINHPFLVSLDYCFQTDTKLYLVVEFMKGGEMYQHLLKSKRFDESRTKFYIACLILGLGHLHNNNYVHRDIKLENILLDEKGYCKLTDFGLAKFVEDGKKALTFCGTPDYLAPEIILNKGHNLVVDWWSLGILMYEMLNGISPFYHRDVNQMFKRIINDKVVFKPYIKISDEAKDLILKLLNKNPNYRLGNNGGSLELINHPWFKNFNWSGLMVKSIVPSFIPDCSEAGWTKNFDKNFIKENVNDIENETVSQNNLDLINKFTKEFNEINN